MNEIEKQSIEIESKHLALKSRYINANFCALLTLLLTKWSRKSGGDLMVSVDALMDSV